MSYQEPVGSYCAEDFNSGEKIRILTSKGKTLDGIVSDKNSVFHGKNALRLRVGNGVRSVFYASIIKASPISF